MKLAAGAFGADRTLFVTNGTTGANSIVYQATLKPDDLVILDRNCHRSHHYAAVQWRQVVYMEPEHVHRYGISGVVPMDTIESTVRAYKDRRRCLCLPIRPLTACATTPRRSLRRFAINQDMVFLFDEAWFAYGIFHPDFRKHSTMAAAKRLRRKDIDASIYVTQSIHKTLSAMRQASMIHISRPKPFPNKLALEESFLRAHHHVTKRSSPGIA